MLRCRCARSDIVWVGCYSYLRRTLQRKNGTKQNTIRECALLLMALAVWTEPALARSFLNCLAKKVVIVDAPNGSTSSSVEENFGFLIDEETKIVTFAEGKALFVRRFDDRWISAA